MTRLTGLPGTNTLGDSVNDVGCWEVERVEGSPTMRILPKKLVVRVLFVLAFFALVGASIILVEGGGGPGNLGALLFILLGTAFVAAAVYLRSRSGG